MAFLRYLTKAEEPPRTAVKKTPTLISTQHCEQTATHKYIYPRTLILGPVEFRAAPLEKCKYTFLADPGFEYLA